MNMFNMQTALLLVGVLYIVMPVFTWIVLGEERNRAASWWCLGGLTMGVAGLLVSAFSAGGKPTLALSLPILLNTLSLAVRVQALRMEQGLPTAWWRMVVVVLSSTLVFEYLHRVWGLYVPRAMYGSLVFVVGGALIGLHAARIARKEGVTMARWLAWAYSAVALAFAFRMLYLSRQDFSLVQGNLTTEGPASILAALVLLLSSVVGHIGYVGLYLERAHRRALLYAEDQARQEVTQQLGAQIAVLERRQSLGELAASIAHELKQPLTAILANAQLAKRGLQSQRMDGDGVQQLLGKIEYNTERASKILERIRNFMRTPSARRDRVDLHEVCKDVLELLEGDLRKHQGALNCLCHHGRNG